MPRGDVPLRPVAADQHAGPKSAGGRAAAERGGSRRGPPAAVAFYRPTAEPGDRRIVQTVPLAQPQRPAHRLDRRKRVVTTPAVRLVDLHRRIRFPPDGGVSPRRHNAWAGSRPMYRATSEARAPTRPACRKTAKSPRRAGGPCGRPRRRSRKRSWRLPPRGLRRRVPRRRRSRPVVRASAEQGPALGQDSLGSLYATGRRVMQDDATDRPLVPPWNEQAHARAPASIRRIYENGYGLRQDPVEALMRYRRAEDHDDFGAPEQLDRLR